MQVRVRGTPPARAVGDFIGIKTECLEEAIQDVSLKPVTERGNTLGIAYVELQVQGLNQGLYNSILIMYDCKS